MPQTLLIEYDNQTVGIDALNKDPESALKSIIAQQTSGQVNKDLFHAVIRTVMPKNDNNLKRLLYYYFDTLDKNDKSLMMCMNQISKDLNSPNEYIRGVVLKFISRMENQDYVSLLIKSVKENMNYKSSYVRINAVLCITELALKFDLEIEQDLIALISKETNPETLRMLFNSMYRLGLPFESYIKNDYPEIVLDTLVDKSEDSDFLLSCVDSKYKTVSFKASCKLLKKSVKKSLCTENILRILETNEELKYDFINYIKYVDGFSLDLIEFIDFFQIEFSKEIISQCFANAETHEFLRIAEAIFSKYKECNSTTDSRIKYKVLLLESLTSFANSHCVYVKEMVALCLKNISTECSELIYASLNYIAACIKCMETKCEILSLVSDHLIKNFSSVRLGKIFRKIFDVLTLSVDKEHYEQLLDTLLDNFAKDVFYLSSDCEVFLGTHICLSLVFMHDPTWNLKAKTIGVMLKFVEVGQKKEIMDLSSNSTIISCVRSILNGPKMKLKGDYDNSGLQEKFKKVDVTEPVNFSLLKNYSLQKEYMWEKHIDSSSRVVQLSGLGDPLYAEANVIHNKYELILDMLIINQTGLYLQDINFEFTCSKYLKQLTKIQPLSLQANSASTMKVYFSITESSSCFITASATFKYPKRAEYASKPYLQNLGEVSLDIKDFLEGANVNFKDYWRDLVWENLYSITLSKIDPLVLLAKIVKELNGEVCEQQSFSNFLVANVACYTIQRNLVLVNACFSVTDSTSVEIRVRSTDEDIVKSVSGLLSTSLKAV